LSDEREPRNLEILPVRATSAAFEVKSLPGGFRKFDALINRDIARGVDPVARVLEGRARAAKDVLHDARPWLLSARDQLHRKASGDGTSMNAFLVIHPLDHLTVESLRDYAMGPYLEPLKDVGDLDTVWVLWPPHHLTMWSRAHRQWINLMFDLMNPDEKRGEFPALQAAEMSFLTRTGHTGGSPYLFTASYGETDQGSS
jgi:hypothetical protein